ncbi:MAG: thioredoxin [Gemmatimonadota bacterium]|nr:thioredoxin [Gemmatimonadota bacterium]
MYPDERVSRFITKSFIPARVHVKDQAADFQRFGERYGAQWTPTILEIDPDGVERHRIEGFLPADDFLAQLTLGLGHAAFKRQDWSESEKYFRDIPDQFPESEAAPEALYWAGVSRYKSSKDATALRDTAKALSGRYQGSSWAKKASIWK